MKIKISVDLRVGRIVKYFVIADLALLAGWGFIEPVFSVFIVQKVAGATLATVGIAAAIYWILKSILQLPIADYIDSREGEEASFHILIAGLLLASFSAFSFSLVNRIWELYLVQMIHAVAFACYVPSWSGIFSHHLDKNRASFDWSLDSTAVGLASGVSGFFGGVLANFWGYGSIFVLASLASIAAAVTLLMVPHLILPRPTTTDEAQLAVANKDHKPGNIP